MAKYTPIVGLGYTRRKVKSDLSEILVNSAIGDVYNKAPQQKKEKMLNNASNTNGRSFSNINDYRSYLTSLYQDGNIDLYFVQEVNTTQFGTNGVP